jgi:mono/diheme cytochrome c family protein
VKKFVFGIIFGLAAFAAVAYFLLERGYIDFGADRTPSSAESKFAMGAIDAWSTRRAGDQNSPVPVTDENITAGATLYLNHCAGCHGVPSNPDSEFQRSFYPPAPGFFREMPDMNQAETFYVVEHGIRWSGMPAWNRTLNDQQIWQIVVFLSNMHKLSPAAQKVFEPVAQQTAKSK